MENSQFEAITPQVQEFFDKLVSHASTSQHQAILYIYHVVDTWCEQRHVDTFRSALVNAPIDLLPNAVLLGLLTAARWMPPVDAERQWLAGRVRALLTARGLDPHSVNDCMRGLESPT